MQNNALFLGMIEQPCMIARLTDELREASSDFRKNPRAFITTALKRDVVGGRRTTLLQLGLAIAILFYTLAFVTMLVFWSLGHHRAQRPDGDQLPAIVLKVPGYFQKVEIPNGDDKPSGGGGGGGNQTNTPPSSGSLPIASLDPLVIAPRPEPQLTPPVLPVTERVMVDPRIQLNHDDLSPTGLPDGVGLTPSAGPGSDRGMGTGPGGGMGPGNGPGVGPGGGGNTGDGTYTIGGAKLKPAVQVIVDERPVLLNRPRPMFTEEARRNKIQGVVRIRVFIDVGGKVAQAVVTRGLPDGLDQEAIRAAYQMRFRPAMKNGSPVVFWLSNVEVEFNLR